MKWRELHVYNEEDDNAEIDIEEGERPPTEEETGQAVHYEVCVSGWRDRRTTAVWRRDYSD